MCKGLEKAELQYQALYKWYLVRIYKRKGKEKHTPAFRTPGGGREVQNKLFFNHNSNLLTAYPLTQKHRTQGLIIIFRLRLLHAIFHIHSAFFIQLLVK